MTSSKEDLEDYIIPFVSAARSFCYWCENYNGEESEPFSLQPLAVLSRVYAAAFLIPKSIPTDAQREKAPLEMHQKVERNLSKLPFRYYKTFFNPSRLNESEVTGDLTDDFIDIYKDLKTGLSLYPHYADDALFGWKLSLECHWGRHAASAIHALHSYVAGKE